MADRYIEQAPGGEITSPDGTERVPASKGVQDYFVQMLNLIARKLHETGGPTTLSMGAVADGQVLKRSGTNIIGYAIPTAVMPKGHLFGMELANNATDPTNDIDISVGEHRSDDNTEDMTLSSTLTKQLDVAWAVGNNQGMLDTGVVADNTYHIFAIKRTDTGVVDVLASLSATSPTMPANYTKKRRIGSIIRSGATILGFVQDGDKFMLKVPITEFDTTNPGITAVTRTLAYTPAGIRVAAILTILAGSGAAAADNPGGILITDLSQADTAPSITVNTFYVYNGGAVQNYGSAHIQVMTNTSRQFRYRVAISTVSTRFTIIAHGWIDTRGRFS